MNTDREIRVYPCINQCAFVLKKSNTATQMNTEKKAMNTDKEIRVYPCINQCAFVLKKEQHCNTDKHRLKHDKH